MLGKKHVVFPGRLVIIGFGSIGQGVLPLLLRHIDLNPDQITIITAELRGQQVAAEYGARFVETALTRENYRAVLDPSEKEVAAAAAASGQTPNRPSRHPPTFILVAISIAVALGIAIPLIMHASESPDRPGLSPPPPKKP